MKLHNNNGLFPIIWHRHLQRKKKKQKTFREQKLEGSIKKINILPAKIKRLEEKSLRFPSVVLQNRELRKKKGNRSISYTICKLKNQNIL